MKRVLWIVSLITLVMLGAGILGQALIVILGVYYTPYTSGRCRDGA